MSAKEKMKEIAQSVSEKTNEYAPIVKEKIMSGYIKSKDFTLHVVVPKLKEGANAMKTKIADFQAKRAEKSSTKKQHYK